ncbi:MAG TPA: DUF2207 domain-containing protein [Verrucomicrobiae bacterium]|nr:DUF2207 domain-containing protein [Verrucomicrobiae bacterium]
MRALFRLRHLFLLLMGLLCALRCYPQTEQILSFHSDITLEEDSSLQVTETIDVFVTGNQIHHGIYREFPTRYRDTFNNRYVVGFQMLGATLDGADEPFRVQDYSNGKRIYLGTPSERVSRGRHIYTISYDTNRQLGFFKDHDELFWNVTGNGWDFPIEHANATVHLPLSIPTDKVKLSGYTGTQGSYQTQLTFAPSDDAFQFATTRPLAPRQGLSILLMWPKGYFAEPTFAEKLQFFFQDNRDALLLSCGFLVLLLYYLIAWSAVGRDPAPGVIMALYEPPQNLSPAGMRYLRRMGFDNKTFSAAILDMAVRGFLTIKEQAGSYTLYLTGKSNVALPPDEQQVAQYLFDGRDQVWLHQENHQTIQGALKALKKWLANAEQKTYFVTNSRYLIAPVILSLVIVISYLVALGMPQVVMGTFLGFWLTIWTLAVAGLVLTAVNAWRGVMHPHLSRFGGVSDTGKAVLVTLFSLPFLGGEAMGIWFLLKTTSLVLVLFLLASGLLHIVFLYLLKAPTFTGRRLMDQVEGFKMFLGAVDGDRLNRVMPPQQTPAVFEKFLPYALALDVEQDWAEKFSTLLAGAGTAPGANIAYAPSFYSGGSWNSFSGTSFASSLGGSLTSAISSSATAPGSGAGGGSGGSGGGGGGGGGGGW